jgi:DEAD/DEAH box helicase domain-containing protein
MDAAAFLNHVRGTNFYEDQIVHVEHLPRRSSRNAETDEPLAPLLQTTLRDAGLLPLYSHQAAAVNAARSGKNVMVATPSASGKTLCYNVPVLEAMLTQKRCRALYLFPTKALAQDQLRTLSKLTAASSPGLWSATFDGDTPRDARSQIKNQAQIVLTNPDMLHLGILPNHSSWSRFLRQLRYVVIDEAHMYRGVFGSHVANIARRLRRICAHYDCHPQFLCCSATIGNPKEHIERLVGEPFEIVDDDGSPFGGKDFTFWNPPVTDQAKSTRRSVNSEASSLFAELIRQGIRSLAFTRTRRLTELVYNYSKERLGDPSLAKKISPYRAGYLPEERREIERALFDGELLGAIATTALELGIDIGSLEATVLAGYPGSISSTWQQAGRSGRRGTHSLSFLIGAGNPLDQYFMRHPDAFFRRGFENALTNPDNPHILKPHLLCAAWESPLSNQDEQFFPQPHFSDALKELQEEGFIRERKGKWYLAPSLDYPAEKVNIRSTSSRYFSIVDTSQDDSLLETVEASVAFSQIHPGAIYLHRGESYYIEELDIESRVAYATPAAVPYYTQARELTDLSITRVIREKITGPVKVYLGQVRVTNTVVGFRKRKQFTEDIVGEEPLDLPPQPFDTVALWFDIPEEATDQITEAQLDFAGALHAAEHAAIAMLPLFALCDRNDIGGVSTPFHSDTGKAQIFLHDACPGGTGIAEKGFELIRELWLATLQTIAECPCEDGCPSCIQSPKCGNNNEPLDKRAAGIMLKTLIRM